MSEYTLAGSFAAFAKEDSSDDDDDDHDHGPNSKLPRSFKPAIVHNNYVPPSSTVGELSLYDNQSFVDSAKTPKRRDSSRSDHTYLEPTNFQDLSRTAHTYLDPNELFGGMPDARDLGWNPKGSTTSNSTRRKGSYLMVDEAD